VDEIIFLKEQAWQNDFATSTVQKTDFHTVLNTSARIKSVPQSGILLSAQSSGTVNLVSVPGETVKKGDLLAVITAAGFEDNLNVKLNEYRIAYEKSSADYQRTKPLAENRTISQKDFLEIRSTYLQDSVRYFQIERNVSRNGLTITAPFEGFISDIPVNNGEYVETGATILEITNDNQVLVEAYVNQSDYQLVNDIFDANLRIPSDGGRVLALSELDGRIRAAKAFAGDNTTRIPVTFSVTNNGLLMHGMFLEAFLLAGRKENALVVPLSAVTEEQGQYYVYVQTGGESFMKREVDLLNNDGFRVEVASGLKEGERIVTRGSYQIKLAAMSGELPLHGHTH
jgi:RND family efflux transporter MFP subunit